MSGIGVVGSPVYSGTNAVAQSGDRSQQIDQQMRVREQQGFDQALRAAGVSDDTRAAIEEDLTEAFGQFFSSSSSSSSPPTREQVQETIRGVLEENGLDAEEVLGQPRLHGGGQGFSATQSSGPGGPPPSGPGGPPPAAADESEDYLDTLLEYLEEATGDSSETLDVSYYSQYILDALLGLDVKA